MAKTIIYNGSETVLPDKPMTLPNNLKSMPVTAAEQVVTNIDTDERLPETLANLSANTVRGFWIAKGDAEGNNMDELFIHYYEDEETGEIVTQIT